MSPKSWPSSVAPAPGAITDVNLIQYLGVACGPLNPVDTDVVDRAVRLLGIIYGENAQVQQLTPADGMGPNESLETVNFLAVYDAVAGDWNRVREGSVVGSVLTEEAPPTSVLEGQVTLTGAAQQLPNDACKSVTLENPSTNDVVCVGHDNAVTLANGYRLQPGATYSMDIDNVNRIWVIGTAPQVISYGGVM